MLFSIGEKIVFEKNDKKLGVSNGTTGELKGIDKDGNLLIKTDDKTVAFNAKEYNYFNHGYAVTSYKAQGQTADNVIAHMPAQGQNFNSFYVTATRAVNNLTIYTDNKKDLQSMIHNEQIKDNATSLNEKFEQKQALDKEQQKQKHEDRKLSRQETYENAPAGDKQLAFAQSIAKELGIENADIGTRVNTDVFIKENLEAFQKAQTVLFYLPIHGEVDLEPLFQKQRKKKQFLLPKVQKNKLSLHYISSLDETAPGKFTIREPHQHLKQAKISDIDLILVPGIAFSKNGHRIGYGKGFYDRLLKKSTCPKIGIAYDFQIVNNIPGEAHDVPMTTIVTEKQTLKVQGQK